MNSIPVSSRVPPRVRHGFTLIEMLVVLAILGLLAALLVPVLSRAKIKARNLTCISQLRQLGIAVRLLAEDNNGVLPAAEPFPTMPVVAINPRPRICDLLGPYLGRAAGDTNSSPVFRCPGDYEGFFETEGSSYWWNNVQRYNIPVGRPEGGGGGVSGKAGRQKIDDSELAAVPLLIDFDDFHPRPPQTGRNAVFGDGHVDKFSVPKPELQ